MYWHVWHRNALLKSSLIKKDLMKSQKTNSSSCQMMPLTCSVFITGPQRKHLWNLPHDSFMRAWTDTILRLGVTTREQMGLNFKLGREASSGIQLTASKALPDVWLRGELTFPTAPGGAETRSHLTASSLRPSSINLRQVSPFVFARENEIPWGFWCSCTLCGSCHWKARVKG